ncbi:hypothetical protein ACMFMG_003140 [Clarireedia jacksonii]
MSSYPYSLLPPDSNSIRLLRLLPNEDEAAPIHCELRNYSLQRLSLRTHLYEALSYVWGDLDKTLSIYVDKNQFQVTVNLYTALLHLRDYSFERVIWVDAICIDQSNLKERKEQVQLMAKIYSNAHRVIVWLGKEVVEIKGALEDIQLAANDMGQSKKEIKQQAILNLLQNPWFGRIWVLQEVAAARHVVIMCGSTTIDGYAFCLGVKSLKLFYTASSELQTLPSVIYLIEHAGLRSKYTANLPERSLPERFSLEIRSLPELIDMFHTRQATDTRDKVYALLGMSSDDPENTGLLPDYQISWEKLFQELVKFVLGNDISVKTSSQRAMIQCKGCILGQVSSVRGGSRQNVTITPSTAWDLHGMIEWTLHASAKPIQEHDIICLLYGASKPTIIRLCKDQFAVIVIAATPLNGSSSFGWPQLSQSTIQFLRDFLLVWDWENPQGKLQDQGEYETLAKIYSQVLESSKGESGYLNEATRLWNDIAILDDLKEYDKADKKLLEARSKYVAVFGKDYLPRLIDQYGRTLLSFAAGEGHEDITKLLLDIVDPDIKDGKYSYTPLFYAAGNGHEAVVKLLLATGQIEADSRDNNRQTPLHYTARNGHEAIVKLLLATGQVKVDSKDQYSQTPLLYAAKNRHEAIVKLLLATGQVWVNSKDQYSQTPLLYAAKNRHEAIVKLLLATGQVWVNSKDQYGRTPLSYAADNGHEAIVKLLLATGQVWVNSKDQDGRKPLHYAAKNGQEAIVKLLLATGQIEADSRDNNRQTPLHYAADNRHEAIVRLLLATGQVWINSKDQYGRTPLSYAADNGHEAIVKLLLATSQVEIDLNDQDSRIPLWYAAKNGHEAIVKMLFAAGQIEIDLKDQDGRTPLSYTAKNCENIKGFPD